MPPNSPKSLNTFSPNQKSGGGVWGKGRERKGGTEGGRGQGREGGNRRKKKIH